MSGRAQKDGMSGKSSNKYENVGSEAIFVEKSEVGSQLEHQKSISKPFSNRFFEKQSRRSGSVVCPGGLVVRPGGGSADFGDAGRGFRRGETPLFGGN